MIDNSKLAPFAYSQYTYFRIHSWSVLKMHNKTTPRKETRAGEPNSGAAIQALSNPFSNGL